MIIKNLCLAILLLISFSVISADSSTDQPVAPGWLVQARDAIKIRNFEKAAEILLLADQKQSADWNNLMGYSLRKKSGPDLADSEKYYQNALKIDPKHRGALEYYGELLLLKKDLSGAENMLNRLDKACRFGCEEFDDLKKSIAQFKLKKTN